MKSMGYRHPEERSNVAIQIKKKKGQNAILHFDVEFYKLDSNFLWSDDDIGFDR